MRRTHTLIAGGGPAGAAAAIVLGRAAARPLIIERTRSAHDVVCGAFLSGDTLSALDQLGIDVLARGGHPVSALRLFAGKQTATIGLPFPAAGFSRLALDAALLDHAVRSGAGVERGTAIRKVDRRALQMSLADGAKIAGEALFLATGKHELRGVSREDMPNGKLALGLRTRLEPSSRITQSLNGHIELFLFDSGYAGIVLQEDGSANLCISIAQHRFAAAGATPETLLSALFRESPPFADRVGQARSIGSWTTISRIPYGWLTGATNARIFRLGDQAAVIASLAGDGLAIALTSGQRAAEHYLHYGPTGADPYQGHFSRAARRPLLIAQILRKLAEHRASAAFGVALLARLPSLARIASRATRIGGYRAQQPTLTGPLVSGLE
jgi:flavin-dependent dehydrogenase